MSVTSSATAGCIEDVFMIDITTMIRRVEEEEEGEHDEEGVQPGAHTHQHRGHLLPLPHAKVALIICLKSNKHQTWKKFQSFRGHILTKESSKLL